VNRRTFLKVALGTVGVFLLDPFKVLSEQSQPLPKKEVDFEIEKTPITPKVHTRKDGLEIKTADPTSFKELGSDARIIDLVRIAYPAMIAHQICSVQPLTEPTGQIFRLRHVRWYNRWWYRKWF
jgi:hypothetical protein